MAPTTFSLAGHLVDRMGFGAMQLPGPGVFGPPADPARAVAILRRCVEAGVNHLDTAQFYGPDVANDLIRTALHPYPEQLVIVSKVGARRDERGGWLPAQRPEELRSAVEQNLTSLGLDQVAVVNLRRHPDSDVPFADQLGAMVELRDEGKIGAVGLSNVTLEQYLEARRVADPVCVQNAYNLRDRSDEPLLARCGSDGVAYVPFFPLGSAFAPGASLLEIPVVREHAHRLGVSAAQLALAWLLGHAPHALVIPGTSSLEHLEENLGAADVELDEAAVIALDGVAATA